MLKWSTCRGVYIIFLLSIALMFCYWFLLKMRGNVSQNDFLNRVVVKDAPVLGTLSWWPVLHLIVFFVIGYFYPTCGGVALTGGVLWEVWEHVFGKYVLKEKSSRLVDGSTQYGIWWSGSLTDIVMNFAGFYLGVILASLVSKG